MPFVFDSLGFEVRYRSGSDSPRDAILNGGEAPP